MRKKLNLTQTNGKKIGISEQKKIRGGYVQMCTCGCCGASGTADNGGANDAGGLSSTCPPV